MDMSYRKLTNLDLQIMSAIAQKAKAYWNYPKEWLQLWEKQLTFTADDLKTHWNCGVCIEKKLVGFVMFSQKERVAEIDNLWVLPEFMGLGIGRKLMTRALSEAKSRELETVLIESDPHAEGFYNKFGAVRVGFIDSTPKPRKLPVLEITL